MSQIKLGLGLGLNRTSAGYKFQPETVTLLSALTGSYTPARKIEIDKMIKSLKTAGVWAKLDVLQIYAAPTAADAVVNWKNPGTFNATLVNSPTLEVDRGFTGDGASSYLNSNYNPKSGTFNFSLNSASHGAYVRTNDRTTNNSIYGSRATSGDDENRFTVVNATDIRALVNVDSVAVTNDPDIKGLTICSRTANNLTTIYANGTSIGTNTDASSDFYNGSFFVCAIRSVGVPTFYSVNQISVFLAGAGLSAGEAAALTTALETYLDYIGAGVVS